jgi:tetratricopeptide (TPR) repeat protein
MEEDARDADPVIRIAKAPAVAALVAAAVTFLVFSSTLGHGFVNWDDDVYVMANPAVQPGPGQGIASAFSRFFYYAYIPVTLLSHAADVELWGLRPRGHHLTNVLLHSANAAWVFLLVLLLLERSPLGEERLRRGNGRFEPLGSFVVGALVASLLFAVHPLRAESVAWISDRKDLLCAFFLVPSVAAYVLYAGRPGRRSFGWYGTSFALFLLAVLSKSIAVVLPVLLLLLDVLWLRRRERASRLVLEKAPFLLVSLVLAGLSVAQSPQAKRDYAVEHLSGFEVALFPFYSLTFSLLKTVLPVDLAPIYPKPDPGWMIAGLAVVLTLTGAALLHAKRGHGGPLLAWLSYLLLLLPNVVGLGSGMQPVADRYSYVSTLGLFMLAGGGIARLWSGGDRGRRIALAVCCVALIVTLTGVARSQAARWRSSTTLWESVVNRYPAKPDYLAAYQNLGAAYAETGHPLKAREILERALAIDPADAEVLYNLGVLAYKEENRPKALEFFRHATRADPRHARAFYSRAVVADQLGLGEEALAAMVQAARLGHPEAQEALRSRGMGW